MTKEKLRKFLIKHLDNCVVPYSNWDNRDTPSAQEGCAKMRMYLRAGCDFCICRGYGSGDRIEDPKKAYQWMLDVGGTCYLSIFHYQFEDDGSRHTSYFPSPHRVWFKGGKDWY